MLLDPCILNDKGGSGEDGNLGAASGAVEDSSARIPDCVARNSDNDRLASTLSKNWLWAWTRNLGEDARWRDWSVVFRSCADLVKKETDDDDATSRSRRGLGTDGREADHLLLHLTSGPALERVVTGGDGEGLRAWSDPKLQSRSADISGGSTFRVIC